MYSRSASWLSPEAIIMPIDYSKWDALVVSDDSDFEEAAPSANSKPVRNLPTPVKTKPPPAKTKPPESKPTSSSQSTASKKAVKKPAPQLPVELWLRIFYFNSTPLHLWSSGRRVCRLWHDWIPKIYAEKYVQNPRMTSIYFDLGTPQTGSNVKPLTLLCHSIASIPHTGSGAFSAKIKSTFAAIRLQNERKRRCSTGGRELWKST